MGNVPRACGSHLPRAAILLLLISTPGCLTTHLLRPDVPCQEDYQEIVLMADRAIQRPTSSWTLAVHYEVSPETRYFSMDPRIQEILAQWEGWLLFKRPGDQDRLPTLTAANRPLRRIEVRLRNWDAHAEDGTAPGEERHTLITASILEEEKEGSWRIEEEWEGEVRCEPGFVPEGEEVSAIGLTAFHLHDHQVIPARYHLGMNCLRVLALPLTVAVDMSFAMVTLGMSSHFWTAPRERLRGETECGAEPWAPGTETTPASPSTGFSSSQ